MVRTGSAPHPRFGDALSPVDRITEIFCGLVMVLTVTLLSARDIPTGAEGVNALLRAALGGNIAWGFIDAVVYLMSQRYEMSDEEALRTFSALHALAGRMAPAPPGLTRRDLIGALACFCLCVGSALPATLPFLLFDAPVIALRVSNGVLLASLFVLGIVWAKLIGARPLLTGGGLLLVGAALVGITITLGG
jgi:VIT1/CCC1 family predicted Fe2+/Mn2+ transporter